VFKVIQVRTSFNVTFIHHCSTNTKYGVRSGCSIGPDANGALENLTQTQLNDVA